MRTMIHNMLRKLGFEVHYVGRRAKPPAAPPDARALPYIENPDAGAVDFAEKLAREARGGPFEWPNIVALNRAAAGLLGDAKQVAELGGGTGCFAWEASADPSRVVVSSELDADASRWAREHRSRPNVTYVNHALSRDDGPFDVVVAVEVIEHVADFPAFLRTCAELAPRALLTTPNRARGPHFDFPGPPRTRKHVREWTAGEFYWVLRAHWRDVRLFATPNPYVSELVPIRVTDTLSPLVADCREPIRP